MTEKFNGSRYDSSGGYEIVPHVEEKMTVQELHDSLVQKAKDDLNKYLSGEESGLFQKFNQAILKDLQEESQKKSEPQRHPWKLITSNKTTALESNYFFWCKD